MPPKKKPVIRKKRARSQSLQPPAELDTFNVLDRSPSPESHTQTYSDLEDTEREIVSVPNEENELVSSEQEFYMPRSEASDDDASTVTTITPAAKRKNTRKATTKIARSLTNDEEDEVIEWLKANRFLYDKSSCDFKNRQKKERTWLEMDEKMQLNPGYLFRWYSSLRTQYVKAVKKNEDTTRSGAGAEDDIVTPRHAWLLKKFEFVKPYVCKSRATRGSKILQPDQQSDSSSTVVNQTPSNSLPESPATSATTASISKYLEQVSQQLTVPKTDIEKTCDFLGMLMAKMTPSCLDDFTNEATCKAMDYVRQSNVERRQSQPAVNTFLQPPQPFTAPNPPAYALQHDGRYQWTGFQPGNHSRLPQSIPQSSAYSSNILNNIQAPNTITSSTTGTTPGLNNDTINHTSSFYPAFN